ncbi:MAG: cytochrome c oxidase subunit II [Acidobacteriota bacterium]|nr:cytochrome c oxidase subunit II [Acidobacteriota bacterium]
MLPQAAALSLFIVVAVLVAAVFAGVALSTRQPHDPGAAAATRLRRWFAGVLGTGLLAALVVTLLHLPYPRGRAHPDLVIYGVGMQYAWGLSTSPITTQDEWQNSTFANPIDVPAGSLVEFRVTSFDVNHGFGVFDPSHHLLGQVQAMPGYENRLQLRLTTPGTYWVFCLELCGMGHHLMRGEFEVVPPGAHP